MVRIQMLSLVCCAVVAQAISDISTDKKIKRHFNHVMMVHIEGLGYALARPEQYPDVDPQRGLARFWEQIVLNGNIDALVQDPEVCALAQELHDCVKKKPAFIEAMQHLSDLQQSNADKDTLEHARFRVHTAYVAAITEEANRRGCPIRRPDSAPKLSELQPGQGGSFAATEAKNWGNLAYLADLVQTNANLDVTTHDCLLKAFALAQLMFRKEGLC